MQVLVISVILIEAVMIWRQYTVHRDRIRSLLETKLKYIQYICLTAVIPSVNVYARTVTWTLLWEFFPSMLQGWRMRIYVKGVLLIVGLLSIILLIHVHFRSHNTGGQSNIKRGQDRKGRGGSRKESLERYAAQMREREREKWSHV